MSGEGLSVVSISSWDYVRIHFLSFIFGFWVILKRLIRWCWNRNAFSCATLRDNPPPCLVDSAIGLHSYVKLKGIKFHYVEAGGRDQPLLLLLHGFPDFWLSWRYQIPIFSVYFHVVAVDLKGFGDSDKPLWRRNYSLENVTKELSQLIKSFGASSCLVIGHDLGALLGWFMVHQHPELIDKFVAVSCPHPNLYWDNLPSQHLRWLNFIQLPYLPEMDALKEDLKIINDCHRHLLMKDSDSYLEAYKYSFSRKEDWTGPINYFRNLPFIRINKENNQIKVPTLLVTGNKDSTINLECIVKSTDYCDKSVVKIVEDTHHFPHQENPDAFNKIVLNYFKVDTKESKSPDRTVTKALMNRMFDAVSSTVKYGNSVLDVVHKRTNGVVGSGSIKALYSQHNSSY